MGGNGTVTDQERKILDGARVEFEAFGLRRANVDAIAKHAKVGRSTLYRHFPSKEVLFRAVMRERVNEFLTEVHERIHTLPPKNALVEAFVAGVRVDLTVPLIARVLDTEPDSFLTAHETVGDLFTSGASTAAIAATLRSCGSTMSEPHLLAVAETLQRIALSLLLFPEGRVDRTDEAAIRAYATEHLARLVD